MKFSKIKVSIIVLLSSIIFLSCNYDPIFYNITKEVALAQPIVTSTIYSVVEDGNKLYCCNGKLFSKSPSVERGWAQVEAGFTNTAIRIVRLAAKQNELYALVTKNAIDNYKDFYVYFIATDGNGIKGEWKKIDIPEGIEVCTIFDNNAPIANKRAFLSEKKSNAIYELNAGSISSSPLASAEVVEPVGLTGIYNPKASSVAQKVPISAAFAGGKTIFSTDNLLTSNNDDYFYHVAQGVIAYKKATDAEWTVINSGPSLPYSIAFYSEAYSSDAEKATANCWLYVGVKNSIQSFNINNRKEATATSAKVVGENLTSSLGDMTITGIWTCPQGSGDIYACAVKYLSTTATSNKNRLWGYYPTREDGQVDTWNVE